MTSFIPRVLRLNRSRSGGNGKYGVFLILAGLVASAALARRQARRQVVAGDDDFDSDDGDFRVFEPPRSTRGRQGPGTVPPLTPPPTARIVPLAGSAPRVVVEPPIAAEPIDSQPGSNPLDFEAATTAELSVADIEAARRTAPPSPDEQQAPAGEPPRPPMPVVKPPTNRVPPPVRSDARTTPPTETSEDGPTVESSPDSVVEHEAIAAEAEHLNALIIETEQLDIPDTIEAATATIELDIAEYTSHAPPRPTAPPEPIVEDATKTVEDATKTIDLPIDVTPPPVTSAPPPTPQAPRNGPAAAPPQPKPRPPSNAPVPRPPETPRPSNAPVPRPSLPVPPASERSARSGGPAPRPDRSVPAHPPEQTAIDPPRPPAALERPADRDPFAWPSEADHENPPTPERPEPPSPSAPRPGLAQRPGADRAGPPEPSPEGRPAGDYPSLIDFASSAPPIPATLTPESDSKDAPSTEPSPRARPAADNRARRRRPTPKPSDQHPSDQHPSDQHPSDQHPSDQHPSDQHFTDPANPRRSLSAEPIVPDVDQSGRPTWPTTAAPHRSNAGAQSPPPRTTNSPDELASKTTEWSSDLSAVLPPAAPQNAVGSRRAAGETVGPVRADRQDSDGVFYGWVIVGAVFVVMAISSGLGFYNASVILAAATDELNASVGAVSGATSLFFAISGLVGYAFSKQIDSVDLRWFFAIGGLVGATALAGLRWVDSVVELYVFFAVFGVGFALAGLVPATTVVTRWFDRRRSVALSIASTGLSVGGIVVTPIASALIGRNNLSGAAPYLAVMWIVGIVPIALFLIRSRPSDMGLNPDGEPARPVNQQPEPQTVATASAPHQPDGLDFASARSSRYYIALCAAYTAIFFGQVGAIAHLFNLADERASNTTANLALGALAGSSVVARLVGGALVMRFDTRIFNASLALIQAVALVLLAVSNSTIPIVATAALFGASVGNLLMLQPLLLAEAFGVRNYGQIFGLSQLIGTLGVAGGPLALGILRDSFDYRQAFLVAAVASFLGFLFIMLAGPTDRIRILWQRDPSLSTTN